MAEGRNEAMIKTKTYSRIMSILFVSAVLLWPFTATAQTPVSYSCTDFGDVVVGTPSTITVAVTNTQSTFLLFDYAFTSNPCGFIASGYHFLRLDSGLSTDISVEWTPSAPGQCTADLQILNGRNVVANVNLTGNAITEAAKQSLPNVNGLLSSFEEWVKNGDIVGKGWGKSASRHLTAFRRMLVKAENLMDRGHTKKAFHQLRATLKLTRFLIRGSAVGELRGKINESLAELKNNIREAVAVAEEKAPELDLLLGSFDEWIASGDIEGKGYGKQGRRHLEEFKGMLVKANDLFEKGQSKKAYATLFEARKMSGHFIRGDAVDDLREMISEVMDSLKA
jgi:hypothetical protein